MKEEPAAAGKGARRRGTPLSTLGFRMGTVVTGGGGALAGQWRGDRRRKSSARGGARGMAGAAAGRRWGVFSGRAGRRGAAVWPVVAGGSGGGG